MWLDRDVTCGVMIVVLCVVQFVFDPNYDPI